VGTVSPRQRIVAVTAGCGREKIRTATETGDRRKNSPGFLCEKLKSVGNTSKLKIGKEYKH
jgi:hypothetical protein